jgi:uncharacterized protein YndB with AHSA1/START domain
MPSTESERGSITQQIRIAASPDVVYTVISRPEHIAAWWFDEADFAAAPGSVGVLAVGTAPGRVEIPIAVVEVLPGRRFAFRWVAPPAPEVAPGAVLTAHNSVLITFELSPDGDGTLLCVTEEGMRELGWEAAVIEDYYNGHGTVWAKLLADLPGYVESLPEGAPR